MSRAIDEDYFDSTLFWLDLQEIIWPDGQQDNDRWREAHGRLQRLVVDKGGS